MSRWWQGPEATPRLGRPPELGSQAREGGRSLPPGPTLSGRSQRTCDGQFHRAQTGRLLLTELLTKGSGGPQEPRLTLSPQRSSPAGPRPGRRTPATLPTASRRAPPAPGDPAPPQYLSVGPMQAVSVLSISLRIRSCSAAVSRLSSAIFARSIAGRCRAALSQRVPLRALSPGSVAAGPAPRSATPPSDATPPSVSPAASVAHSPLGFVVLWVRLSWVLSILTH